MFIRAVNKSCHDISILDHCGSAERIAQPSWGVNLVLSGVKDDLRHRILIGHVRKETVYERFPECGDSFKFGILWHINSTPAKFSLHNPA